jgi:hypothetical protein
MFLECGGGRVSCGLWLPLLKQSSWWHEILHAFWMTLIIPTLRIHHPYLLGIPGRMCMFLCQKVYEFTFHVVKRKLQNDTARVGGSTSLVGLSNSDWYDTEGRFCRRGLFSPCWFYTQILHISGLRWWTPRGHQQCGVPILVLVTLVRK